MGKKLKGLGIGFHRGAKLIRDLTKEPRLSHLDIGWSTCETIDSSESLKGYDFSVLNGSSCLEISPMIKFRSVGSHFLNYTDFITLHGAKAWGHSLFSGAFADVFLSAVKNQRFKGPVIFLGRSSKAYPTIETLARFGFEEFVFLDVEPGVSETKERQFQAGGLIDIKFSTVTSDAFIQSEKEYAFCFVMEDRYPQQTLDDMSYFHFLSSQSIVFDFSGRSNFFFKEVQALGVQVTGFQGILENYRAKIVDKIIKYAS